MSQTSVPKYQRSRLRDQRGLTLLEVVVTLTILTMLGVMAAEAIRLGRSSWEKHKTQADAEQRIRVVYDTLAQEMASIQPVTEDVDGMRVIAFEGWADRVVFYGRPDPYQPFPYNAMVRSLSFSVDRDRGLVMHERFPLLMDDAYGSRTRVVEPKVRRIEFRYLLREAENFNDSNWLDRWVPIEFVRALKDKTPKTAAGRGTGQGGLSDQGGGLPLAIELSVTIAESRQENKFNFVIPVVVGGYL